MGGFFRRAEVRRLEEAGLGFFAGGGGWGEVAEVELRLFRVCLGAEAVFGLERSELGFSAAGSGDGSGAAS